VKILILGKNGQVGRSFQNLISNYDFHEFTFVGRDELNLLSSESISKYFENNNQFDVIINFAAYTAVDKAEEEEEFADKINHLAAKQIAQLANSFSAKLIHISTDYVFDGKSDSPYLEHDDTYPINAYGRTKLLGEDAILKVMSTNALIIRTSWVYSEFGYQNFVKTILKLGSEKDRIRVVNDQVGSPTYAMDLAKNILIIMKHKSFIAKIFPSDIYHFSNLGEVSWYEFAKEIFKLANLKCKVSPISSKDYQAVAKRPHNSALNNAKIVNQFGLPLSPWRDSLRGLINKLL